MKWSEAINARSTLREYDHVSAKTIRRLSYDKGKRSFCENQLLVHFVAVEFRVEIAQGTKAIT